MRAVRAGYHQWWHPFLRLARFELEPADEAEAQLSALGRDPGQVRWVCLSHLHTDHVGGVSDFPRAEVLVAAGEWERARGRRGLLRGYVPQHWPASVAPRLVHLGGPPVGPFIATHDVAGDGRLLLVPLPGHTPHHMGLLVRGRHRTWLLAGDLVHSPSALAGTASEVDAFCRRQHVVVLTAHDGASGQSAQSREDPVSSCVG